MRLSKQQKCKKKQQLLIYFFAVNGSRRCCSYNFIFKKYCWYIIKKLIGYRIENRHHTKYQTATK